MTKAKPTKAAALQELMRFSKFGGLAQMFVMDALFKNYKPESAVTCRRNEHNESAVARLLKADALRGTTDVLDAVTKQAEGMEAAGLEGVRKSFAKAGGSMVHPEAWHGVALEILEKLRAAR